MKTTRTSKTPRLIGVALLAIALAEYASWVISERFGLTNSPVMVAVLSAGVVAVLADAYFDDPRHPY